MTAVEYVDCPDCDYPLDPATLPRHPVHDFTAEELAVMAASEEAAQAKADAQWWAQIRAEENRARAAAARERRRNRGTRKTTTRRSR